MVVTDHLGKEVQLVLMLETTAKDTASEFINHSYRYHTVPHEIISDQGSQFVSSLWSTLCSLLRIDPRLFSVHQPLKDGSI